MQKRFYRKHLAGSFDSGPRVHRPGVRPPAPSDSPALAQLMLDGYRGTIDYEGEELEDAVEAVYDYFDSNPMLDHSYILAAGDRVRSAVLLMRRSSGEPMVSYVMTAPKAKGQGLAADLLELSLAGLVAAGESSVCAYITDGNTPSERLFKRAGFVEVTEHSES